MNFSITTGETPHQMMLEDYEKNPDELKTWLYKYYEDFKENRPPAHSEEKEWNPSRAPEVRYVHRLDAVDLGINKSRLCPFPLLINVEEEDKLHKIADNVRSSDEYNHFIQGLKTDSSEQEYPRSEKDMAERLVKVLQMIVAKSNPDDISHKFVNIKYKSIEFDDEPSAIPPSPHFEKKPDIILVPKNIPESEMNLWKNVTTAIKLKGKSSDDLATTLLHQISRYALAMIYCRTFTAVTYQMTITGNIARIYRYDAESFCLTEGALITDPEGFKTFCKYIAFMAHPNREKECFRVGTEFQVEGPDESIITYSFDNGGFEVLCNRLQLFVSRTVCLSGQAREISRIYPREVCEISGTVELFQDGTTELPEVLHVQNATVRQRTNTGHIG